MSDATRKEILVLDNAIADRETLLQGLPNDVEVILLGGGDSLAELADALSGRTDIDALHIFSHGSAGQLYLGGETLNAEALVDEKDALARIGAALSTDGDILLYGCNTGAGEAGQAFVEQLALATSADVAASIDATGTAAMGGDWELEVRSGVLDNALPLSREAMDRYGHLLGVFDFENATSIANGYSANALVQQIKEGVTMSVTATPVVGYAITHLYVGDGTSPGFTSKYMFSDYISPNSVTFSFNSAVNISTLMIDTMGDSADALIFTPTGGTNAVVNHTTTLAKDTMGIATLNWAGVTSFTITKNGSGDINHIFVDDIIFTTGPVISITDVTVTEGDSGIQTMDFTVTRTDSTGALTVDYATANDSAIAGSDYQVASGTLSFAPGEASKTISVTINGDTLIEGNETFKVNLSNASTGTISDAQGVGTITNDDTGSLTYSTTTFVEAMSDDGTIGTTATITLTGDTFVGHVGDPLAASFNGVPAGLITSLVKTSDTTATLSFSGTATAHGSDPLNSLQVSFDDAAFTGGSAAAITNATMSNLKFDFVNTYNIDCIVPASNGVISTNAAGNIMKADSGTSGGIKFQNIVAQSGYTLVAQNNSNDWVTVTEGTVYANGGLFDKNSGDGVTVYYGIQGNFSGLTTSVADAIVWRLDLSNDGTLDYQDSISLWYVPTPGAPDLAAASDSGVSNTDNITSDTTPTFTGTAEAGATVKLYDTDGTTEIGSGTADGSGNWSITTSALAFGPHTVTAKIWDAVNSKLGNASDSLQITIDIIAPVITSGDTATAIDENIGAGHIIYTVTSTNTASTIYSLKPGVGDVAAFSINATGGAVTLTGNPDYETKAIYAFTVIATDAAGNAGEQAVTLAVNDANEAPVITSGDTGAVVENAPISTVIYTATASDVDAGTTLVYSLTGADADLLNIDASTGEVTLKNPADFEIKNSYSFNVVATDNGAGSLTGSKAVTVSVTDMDETPTISSATYDATTGVLTVTGAYIEANGSGADIDAQKFTLTGEGGETYTLTDTTDVERESATQFTLTLSDADRAAVNQIINKNGPTSTGGTPFNLAAGDDWCTNVTAGDTSDATNAVTVSSVSAPTITNATYNSTTGVLTVTGTNLVRFAGAANDIDVSKLSVTGTGGSYTLTSLSGVEITSATSFTVTLTGADKIQVDARLDQTGTQSSDSTTYNLAAGEDWAAGADAAVTVADETGNGITVTVNTAPEIISNGGGATAAVSVTENVTAVTTVQATDIDAGQTLSYNITGGADLTKFSVDANSGALSFKAAPDFENPTDTGANNTYEVIVQASDGNGGTDTQTITVAVTDVSEGGGSSGGTPTPTPTPTIPAESTWDSLPDDDGDGIPEAVENFVPGLAGGAQGDGNSDGIQDTQQANVCSVPFRNTDHISQDANAERVFITLEVDADSGQSSVTSASLHNVRQLDAPDSLPDGLDLPLGLISFEASVATAGDTAAFSLYVDDSMTANGYWKQNAAGTWVNLASAEYGGAVVVEGGKTRLDFAILDGGEFDADGAANGTIVDPGGVGYVAGADASQVVRFYSAAWGKHMFTSGTGEIAALAAEGSGWTREGNAWTNPSGTADASVFRFYNPYNNDHFFTANAAEAQGLIANTAMGYAYEGVAFMLSSDETDQKPVYRFYNAQSGEHFYTTSTAEADYVVQALGFSAEGVLGYAEA